MAYVLTVASYDLQAQQAVRPCDTAEGQQFDFWVGEWELTWPAEQFGGKKGERGHGKNTITKVLDKCIVQEKFRFPGGNFNGHSVSVYIHVTFSERHKAKALNLEGPYFRGHI